jgi:hypothetical protein
MQHLPGDGILLITNIPGRFLAVFQSNFMPFVAIIQRYYG